MLNIASIFKEEILRLSNKSAREHVAPVQSTAAALRRQVATLRKQVHTLEREFATFKKQVAREAKVATPEANSKVRFTAKGIQSQRARLNLSAEDFGLLVGVSSKTIYSWEKRRAATARFRL